MSKLFRCQVLVCFFSIATKTSNVPMPGGEYYHWLLIQALPNSLSF